jgi:ATP-dependent protease ClpP protease subunit
MRFIYLILLISGIFADEAIKTEPVKRRTITLDESNHMSIVGEIDDANVGHAIKQLANIKGDEIYIYIDSPGGSVSSGDKFVSYMDFLQGQEKTIICVAENAMSMAFHIFENCDKRYMTQSGLLMQHQISLNSRYQELNKLNHQVEMIYKIEERMLKKIKCYNSNEIYIFDFVDKWDFCG